MERHINNLRDVDRLRNLRINRKEFLKASGVEMPVSNSIEGIPQLKFSLTQGFKDTLYPYHINKITIGNGVYFFKEELNADVSFKDGLFYIVYPDLKIVVWGDTREDAEEAFDFMLRHLIVDIYLTNHIGMNLKTLRLKSLLHDLIESE